MTTVTIGRTAAGPPLQLDVAALVEGGGFVTASSGQGKSWLLRLIIERTASLVQQIVVDPEGEFNTLREQFPFLLVGAGGEAAAELRSARLLARKLAELKLSAVLDLYDLGSWDKRREYLAEFLTGLMAVPKSLYHPLLVTVDEAHEFAPKTGGAADKPVGRALAAMNHLASAGRKRGFRLLAATQRITKIHNDTIADLKTRFIGGFALDTDQARAGDELGLGSKADRQVLRDLEPGEFFTYGPAVGRKLQRFTSAAVATTHPKTGQQKLAAPPPTPDAIKQLAAALADLPAEAQAEADELARLKRQVADLRQQLAARPVEKVPERVVQQVQVPVITAQEIDELRAIAEEFRQRMDILEPLHETLAVSAKTVDDLARVLSIRAETLAGVRRPAIPVPAQPLAPDRSAESKLLPPAQPPLAQRSPARESPGDVSLGKAHRAVLTVLAQHGPRTKVQVAVLTGYAVTGGGFNNALGALRSAGYIEGTDPLEITAAGAQALGHYAPLPTGRALLDYWLARCGKAERAILQTLADAWPATLSKVEVAERAGYIADGGGFNNALGRLRTLELVTRGAELAASDELMNG